MEVMIGGGLVTGDKAKKGSRQRWPRERLGIREALEGMLMKSETDHEDATALQGASKEGRAKKIRGGEGAAPWGHLLALSKTRNLNSSKNAADESRAEDWDWGGSHA